MSTIHEQELDVLVLGPTVIVQAVVQNKKRSRVDTGLAVHFLFLVDALLEKLLSFDDVLDDGRRVFIVDKDAGHDIAIEFICRLGGRDHGADRDVAMVIEQVFDQEGLARLTLADKYNDLVVCDSADVEFFEVEVHR